MIATSDEEGRQFTKHVTQAEATWLPSGGGQHSEGEDADGERQRDELASRSRTAATSSLYGLESTGALTTGLAVALMLAVAGVAGHLPARRAARLTPMQALRHD